MNKNIKQIYASLEFRDNEIVILIAEYYNSRFNVIKLYRNNSKAIKDYLINDVELLKQDLKKSIIECSNDIGAKIEGVLLLIPAYNFKRIPLRSRIVPEEEVLSKKDLSRSLSNALNVEIDDKLMIVNSLATKYTIGSLASRRFPLGEPCESLDVDVDLLCADKELVYDYVSLVEAIGLKVLDIVLKPYAIAKEASLLEESLKQNILILDIGFCNTNMSILNKGRLISSEIIGDGLVNIFSVVFDKYHINDDELLRLIKYNVDYSYEYKEDVVYSNGDDVILSTDELNKLCKDAINKYVDKIVDLSRSLLETGTNIFVVGIGEEMKSLVKLIKEKTNTNVRAYYPDTIGVRNPDLVSIYGSLFVYREKAVLNDLNVTAVNLLQYDSLIDQKEIDIEGETITTKIKAFFKQYIEGENKNDD